MFPTDFHLYYSESNEENEFLGATSTWAYLMSVYNHETGHGFLEKQYFSIFLVKIHEKAFFFYVTSFSL